MSKSTLFPKSNNRTSYSAGRVNSQPVRTSSTTRSQTTQDIPNGSPSGQIVQKVEISASKPLAAQAVAINFSANQLSPLDPEKDSASVANSEQTFRNATSTASKTTIKANRPEVLSISQFKPLYDESKKLTNEGQLFDAYVKSLQFANAKSIETLKQILGQQGIQEKNDAFKKQIEILRTNTQRLNDFIKKISTAKTTFDIATKDYDVDMFDFIESSIEDATQTNKQSLRSGLLSNGKYNLKSAIKNVRTVEESFFNQVEDIISFGNNLGKGVQQTPANKKVSDAVDNWSRTKLFLFSSEELKRLNATFSLRAYSRIDVINSQLSNSTFEIQQFAQEDTRLSLAESFKYNEINVDATYALSESSKFFLYNSIFDDSTLKKDFEIPLCFYVPFKELNKKLRYQGVNLTDDEAKSRYNSFLGEYPKSAKTIWSLSDVSAFAGDKLPDLAYFSSLQNVSERILALEPSKNSANSTLRNLDSYMLFDDSENAEEFLTESTVKTDRIRDFKNFLNRLFDLSYDNLIDLSGLPIPDEFISSTEEGFVTTDATKILSEAIDLINTVERKEFSKTYYLDSNETDTDMSIESFYKIFSAAIFGRRYDDKKMQSELENALFSYVKYKINSDENPDENLEKSITQAITKTFFRKYPGSDFKQVDEDVVEDNQFYSSFDTIHSLVRNSLKNSGFVPLVVSFFKKYEKLGDYLALFFHGFLRLCNKFMNVRISNGKRDTSDTPNYSLAQNCLILLAWKKPLSADQKNAEKTKIQSVIKIEQNALSVLSLTILSTISRMKAFATSLSETADSFDEAISQYFLRYLNEDKKKLSTLFTEQQLSLLLSNIEDLYQSYEGFNSTDSSDSQGQLFAINNESIHFSPIMVAALNQLFQSDAEFLQTKGYNKQIISVGLPRGLLKSMIDTKTPNNKNGAKQNDVIRIKIYKMDLLNPYVIYKPKSFLFEASRYPVKVYSELKKLDVTNVQKITGYTTRNYSLFTDLNFSKLNIDTQTYDLTNTFGDEYSFLKVDVANDINEKREILKNHNMSFFLENYVRVMTGLAITENSFTLTTPEEIQKIYESITDDKDREFKAKSNTFTSVNQTSQNNAFLTNATAVSSVRSITAGFNPQTPASDTIVSPDLYIQKIVQPKKFDRVFNIIFDPEFEVDYSNTNSLVSEPGQEVGHGKIQNAFSNVDSSSFNQVKEGVYQDKDKTPGDVALNAYFVSVETYA